MVRPEKCRCVKCKPKCMCFYPGECTPTGEIIMKMDELEAIRLIDKEGLKQDNAAKKMGISQSTFQRILQVGRRKLADSILNAKELIIKNGN